MQPEELGHQTCARIDVFLIDLNADVTSPIETPASWAVSVTEAPAICSPTMNPLSKPLRSSPLATFIQKQNLLRPARLFYTGHRAWLDANCLIVPCCAPVWKHLRLLFLRLFFLFFFPSVCHPYDKLYLKSDRDFRLSACWLLSTSYSCLL